MHRIFKAGTLLLGAVLACAATINSAANALRERAPALVARFPGESQAPIMALDLRFMTTNRPPPASQVVPAARRSLRGEPLDASAFHLLAFSGDPKGTSAAAVAFASLGARITRRDLMCQLILIDDAARRDQSRLALEHYDASLRAHPVARPLLYTALKGALVSPGIRGDLALYIARRSPWALDFIAWAALDPKSVGRIGDVAIRAGRGFQAQDIARLGPPLLSRLLEAREYARASQVLAMIPGGSPAMLSSADWTAASIGSGFGLAGWQVSSDATSSANFMTDRTNAAISLSVYAASGASERVASKLLFLAPGTYTLSQQIKITAPADKRQQASWRLVCIAGDRNAVIWQSGNLLARPGQVHLSGITAPADCGQQRLDLGVSSEFGVEGFDLLISRFHLARSNPVR